MPNVATLFQAAAWAQYQRNGVQHAVEVLKMLAGLYESTSDNLDQIEFENLTTTVTNVSAGASRLYMVTIVSPAAAAAAAFVQVFNVAAASVTLGTTAPRLALVCPAEETTSYLVFPGNSDNMFGTRISVAATTTPGGSTALAAASLPDVFLWFTGE